MIAPVMCARSVAPRQRASGRVLMPSYSPCSRSAKRCGTSPVASSHPLGSASRTAMLPHCCSMPRRSGCCSLRRANPGARLTSAPLPRGGLSIAPPCCSMSTAQRTTSSVAAAARPLPAACLATAKAGVSRLPIALRPVPPPGTFLARAASPARGTMAGPHLPGPSVRAISGMRAAERSSRRETLHTSLERRSSPLLPPLRRPGLLHSSLRSGNNCTRCLMTHASLRARPRAASSRFYRPGGCLTMVSYPTH